MKRILNTLFVTTQGAYLSRERETVLVTIDKEVKLSVPIHTLCAVVCLGRVSCSPWLMHLCADNGVALSFLSENGRFLARVTGPVSGNVLLRRAQYRAADDPHAAAGVARAVLAAKIANNRNVLLRSLRDHPDSPGCEHIEHATHKLARIMRALEQAPDLDTLRGLEGDAARHYFNAFDHLITAQKQNFFFRERTRRPPLDNVNALLSFLYTLLAHDTAAALETAGLDPAVGFLHRDRPGRPSLALDIMEEFRPVLADRLSLTLINRQQIRPSGFRQTETGAVSMDDETRKQVLVSYQNRKQQGIRHPFINKEMPMGLLIHTQAMLLARRLRGDLDAYPPFLWK